MIYTTCKLKNVRFWVTLYNESKPSNTTDSCGLKVINLSFREEHRK